MSAAQARDVVGVPPRVAAHMREFAARHPEEGRGVLASLEFRRRVLEAFEALLLEKQNAEIRTQNGADATETSPEDENQTEETEQPQEPAA